MPQSCAAPGELSWYGRAILSLNLLPGLLCPEGFPSWPFLFECLDSFWHLEAGSAPETASLALSAGCSCDAGARKNQQGQVVIFLKIKDIFSAGVE